MAQQNNASRNDPAARAALNKALHTAYLEHQIAELEGKVKGTHLSSGVGAKLPAMVPTQAHGQGLAGSPAGSPWVVPGAELRERNVPGLNGGGAGEGGTGGGGAGGGEVAGGSAGRHARDPNDDLGRPDDVELDEAGEGEGDWRVVVVDISALLWARNAVKRLVAKGWEVIVPGHAIDTLDKLKTGACGATCAVAARQTARYIEHASRFHSLLSSDPSITVQSGTSYKRGRGLRLSTSGEVLPVESMLDELAIPPMDGEENLPAWVEAVFKTVAYFKRVMDAEERELAQLEDGYERERGPILYVGNAPVFVEVEQGRIEPTPSARDGEKKRDGFDFIARAEGHVVLQEAARFDLTLQVLRDDDVEVEAAGLGGRGRGARGRGRGLGDGLGPHGHHHGGPGGRGGKAGRGRRGGVMGGPGGTGGRREAAKETEPDREVKILLRRPLSPNHAAPAPQTNGNGIGNGTSGYSPASAHSVLPSPNSPAPPGPQIHPRSPGILARPPGPPGPPPLPGMHGRPPPPSGWMGARPPPAGSLGMISPPSGVLPHRHAHPHHHHHQGMPGSPPLSHQQHHRPPPPFDLGNESSNGGAPMRGRGRGGGGRGRSGKGRGGGGGGGGRGEHNGTNEFVLLQRPHSFVRPPPPSSTPAPNTATTSTSPNPTPATTQGRSRGAIPRIDDPPQVEERRRRERPEKEKAPQVVLLQRPK